MAVSETRRPRDAVADKSRMISDYLVLQDLLDGLIAGKGGAAGADDGTHRLHNPAGADDGTHRLHNPAAAAAATCSDSSSPAAESALPAPAESWQPLPRSVPKRRRVGSSPTPTHPRETGQMSRRDLVGDGASKTSHDAYSQREQALQEAFVKYWNRVNPLPQKMMLHHAPPPPPQINPPSQTHGTSPPPKTHQDASQTPSPAQAPPKTHQDASQTPSPAQVEASKGNQQGFVAQLAFAAAVIMGIRNGISDQLSGWYLALKVIFVLLLILGATMLVGGLMATSPVISTGYTHTVLSNCARLCTCLAAFLLIVDLSLLMGSYGYIAGIILGLVAVLFAVSIWIKGDPAAYGVYMRVWTGTKHLCGCFKWSRERGPILPR